MYTGIYESSKINCAVYLTVGSQTLPLIARLFRPALRTVRYRLVGMAFLRSYMRSRSPNVHPFTSGAVLPSPGSPDGPCACTESQKEVD